jgi:hypothetical protein
MLVRFFNVLRHTILVLYTIIEYRITFFFRILFCVGYYILKNVPAIYDAGSIFQFATSHNTSTIYHYRVPYTHYGKFRIIEYITIIYLPVGPYIFLPIRFCVGYYIRKKVLAICCTCHIFFSYQKIWNIFWQPKWSQHDKNLDAHCCISIDESTLTMHCFLPVNTITFQCES